MKKAALGGVMKQKTPSEQNCLTVFVRIFVNWLSVERNHSLKAQKLRNACQILYLARPEKIWPCSQKTKSE